MEDATSAEDPSASVPTSNMNGISLHLPLTPQQLALASTHRIPFPSRRGIRKPHRPSTAPEIEEKSSLLPSIPPGPPISQFKAPCDYPGSEYSSSLRYVTSNVNGAVPETSAQQTSIQPDDNTYSPVRSTSRDVLDLGMYFVIASSDLRLISYITVPIIRRSSVTL